MIETKFLEKIPAFLEHSLESFPEKSLALICTNIPENSRDYIGNEKGKKFMKWFSS